MDILALTFGRGQTQQANPAQAPISARFLQRLRARPGIREYGTVEDYG